MKTLLSYSTTKDELSVYLSLNRIENVKHYNKSYVIAYQNKVVSTTGLHEYKASYQEEADTKLIHHATSAYRREVTKIDIHSADTDVLVLCLSQFEKHQKTHYLSQKANKRDEKSIYQSIAMPLLMSQPRL